MVNLVLAALVYLGNPQKLGPVVQWDARPPRTDASGTCAKPVAVPATRDSLWYKCRVFGIPRAGLWRDDSVFVSRRDTVRVTMVVPRVANYIGYEWAYRYGFNGGRVQLSGCARSKFLTGHP